jgi:hypothetical protein
VPSFLDRATQPSCSQRCRQSDPRPRCLLPCCLAATTAATARQSRPEPPLGRLPYSISYGPPSFGLRR